MRRQCMVAAVVAAVLSSGTTLKAGDTSSDALNTDAVGGYAAAYASCTVVPNYTGPLFELTRLSDHTTRSFSAAANGRPDLSALQTFTKGTLGYVTRIYDQSGNGNHVSQTVLASAPYIDLTRRLAGGCPPIVADWSRRNYSAELGPFIGSSTSNIISITGTPRFRGPLPPGLAPGMSVSGPNIPADATITAIDFANNTVTLSAAPVEPVSFSLPSGTGLTWNIQPQGRASFTVSGRLPSWLAAGTFVTGINIPTYDRIESIRYDSQTNVTTVTLTAQPSGNPSNITLSAAISIFAPKVFMNLPAAVRAPFDNHSLFVVTRPGGAPRIVPVTLGASADTANGAEAFDQFVLSGYDPSSSFRISAPHPYYHYVPTTTFTHRGAVDLYGMTRSGGTIRWYAEEASGIAPVKEASGSTLVGGSLFYTQQFPCDDDEEMYAALIYPIAITAEQEASLKSKMTNRFDIQPRVNDTLTFDGSSTTAGNGTDGIQNTSHMTSDMVYTTYPNRPFTLALSALIEGEAFALPAVAALQSTTPGFDTRGEKILVYHPGLGNSIMAHASTPISRQDGRVLTISASESNGAAVRSQGDPFENGILPGFYVTGTDLAGNSVIPTNTEITAVEASLTGAKPPYTITLSNAPTGTVARVTTVNDTGAVAWANIKTYIASANAAGFKVVLIGSASRWWFESTSPSAPTWLQEFHNAKALMAGGWKAAGAIAYIDLESDYAFGADWIGSSDGTATRMNVTSVNSAANQVTVAQFAKYTAVGNYVAWPGMLPPAPYIKAISGKTLTLSQMPPSSLTAISDFDRVPWEHYSAYWNLDGQHFTYAGYERISKLTAEKLLNGIVHKSARR